MLRLGLTCAWLSSSAIAVALELNTARESDLDGLKGLGPSITRRILDARTQAPFTDWTDLMQRVSGIRHPSALRLSAQGLTVNGIVLPQQPALAVQSPDMPAPTPLAPQ
jgi:competence protein ComEA